MKIKKIMNKILRRTRNKSVIKEIDYETLKKLIKNNANIIVVDTRSPQEFTENRIKTAINIPVYDISKMAYKLLPNRTSNIVLYCQSGERSKKACTILEKLGYTNLYNLYGGLDNI